MPSSTPLCEDYLTNLSDLTNPDCIAVLAGAALDNRWEVRSSDSRKISLLEIPYLSI